jgi:quercetin dioxygenase-like cupin family protein
MPAGAGQPTPVPSSDRQVKATGDDSSGAFMVVEYVLSEDIPVHVHIRQHESLYVLDGRLDAWVGDDEFVAGPGDFLFLPSGLPHALLPISDPPPRLLVIATPHAVSGGVWPVNP